MQCAAGFHVRAGSSGLQSGLRARDQTAIEADDASDTGRLAARTRRISLSRTKSWEKARLSKKCSRCSSPRSALLIGQVSACFDLGFRGAGTGSSLGNQTLPAILRGLGQLSSWALLVGQLGLLYSCCEPVPSMERRQGYSQWRVTYSPTVSDAM